MIVQSDTMKKKIFQINDRRVYCKKNNVKNKLKKQKKNLVRGEEIIHELNKRKETIRCKTSINKVVNNSIRV